MNTLTIILLVIVVWMAYAMYQSYIGMQKELREIRLKCMGTPESKYATKDPVDSMKDTVIGTLVSLATMSE